MRKLPLQKNSLTLLALSFLFAFATPAFASSGTIDSVQKYAFSNVGGYINFAPTNGGVAVSSTGLTGYAWSANDGWISFTPANGGVTNDGTGTLSGFAWDESAGWVNFSGVTIDSSGLFHGTATGGTVHGVSYAINFDCSTCAVVTTWRRPVSNVVSHTGAISPVYLPPPLTLNPQTVPILPPVIVEPAPTNYSTAPGGGTYTPKGTGISPVSTGKQSGSRAGVTTPPTSTSSTTTAPRAASSTNIKKPTTVATKGVLSRVWASILAACTAFFTRFFAFF